MNEKKRRGRKAKKPTRIPASGWRDILLRVFEEQGRDNLGVVAAGVAFFALFSIVPAITALVSVYGLFSDPMDVQQHLASLKELMPESSYRILRSQVTDIAANSNGRLGFGLAIGIVLALWSAAKGTKSLMTALNIVNDEEETRGILKFNAFALVLTFGAIMFMIVALTLIVAVPGLLGNLGLPFGVRLLVAGTRWVLLAGFIILALSILYWIAPDRSRPKWRWVSWGAVLATLFWLIGSYLFSWYVAHFNSFNATYGSMGVIIILLTWLYLTAYLVLVGAELNAEMEHQTEIDTTRGKPQPQGERNAYMADTVGKKP